MTQSNNINGPTYDFPKGTQITKEMFTEHMMFPWYINGIFLDDIGDIRALYKDMMLATKNPEEMLEVIKQFGWLAWDAKRVFEKYVNENNFKRIKALIEKGQAGETMTPIVLPQVMFWARMVSDKFNLPQFPAACQYMMAKYFSKSPEIKDALPEQSAQVDTSI